MEVSLYQLSGLSLIESVRLSHFLSGFSNCQFISISELGFILMEAKNSLTLFKLPLSEKELRESKSYYVCLK